MGIIRYPPGVVKRFAGSFFFFSGKFSFPAHGLVSLFLFFVWDFLSAYSSGFWIEPAGWGSLAGLPSHFASKVDRGKGGRLFGFLSPFVLPILSFPPFLSFPSSTLPTKSVGAIHNSPLQLSGNSILPPPTMRQLQNEFGIQTRPWVHRTSQRILPLPYCLTALFAPLYLQTVTPKRPPPLYPHRGWRGGSP